MAVCGKPRLHTLWRPAAKDREFKSAVKQNRMLTLRRSNVGNRRDFGIVGYIEVPESLHLVFPRSLKRFEGKRIVGISYDLVS